MKKATEFPDMSEWTDEQIDQWLETHDVSELVKESEGKKHGRLRTSTGMPRISQDTFRAVISRYANRKNQQNLPDWGEYLETVKKRLINEDENAVRFIEILVGQNFSPDQHDRVFACLIGLYALLEQQVEANALAARHARHDKGRTVKT